MIGVILGNPNSFISFSRDCAHLINPDDEVLSAIVRFAGDRRILARLLLYYRIITFATDGYLTLTFTFTPRHLY